MDTVRCNLSLIDNNNVSKLCPHSCQDRHNDKDNLTRSLTVSVTEDSALTSLSLHKSQHVYLYPILYLRDNWSPAGVLVLVCKAGKIVKGPSSTL